MPHGIKGSAPQCKVEGCARKAHARGWCGGHYETWRRIGVKPTEPLGHCEPPHSSCRVEGCSREARGRGWCTRHYLKWRRFGDPLAQGPHGPSAEERFWARVDRSGPTPVYAPQLGPCWIWTGKAKEVFGYGVLVVNWKRWSAHRFAYSLLVGPVPDALELDHLCRVPACCNPAHLEPVTHKENLRRADWSGNRNRPPATHCKRGHPFDEENTVMRKSGKRMCRACCNLKARERHHRKRAEGG